MRSEARLGRVLIGSSSLAPWTIAAHIPGNLEPGTYDLTLSATDDVGNVGQTTVSVQLTAPIDTNATFLITSPSSHETWSRQTFPKTITLNLSEPTKYRRLDVNFVGTDGILRLAGNETLPTASEVTLRLPLGPPAGTYQLHVVGLPQDEATPPDTASIPITVTD